MKKLLLSVLALASFANLYAQCSDVFISQYVEGSGNNKALGIYNPTPNPINLGGNYRLIRYNNGTSAAAGEANSQAMINLGNHTIASGDEWVIVIDMRNPAGTGQTAPAATALQAVADTFLCPDYNTSYAMYFNGNDALSLQKTTNGGATWSYVDIFGMIGDAAMTTGVSWSDAFPYDGSVGAWWTINHTLIRKASVQQGVTVNPSPEFIVTTEWDSLPENTFSHLGTHSCSCITTGIAETNNSVPVKIFPNPASSENVSISTPETIESITIYNTVGQQVLVQTENKANKYATIDTGNLSKGIYFVKVSFGKNKNSIVKLSIQ